MSPRTSRTFPRRGGIPTSVPSTTNSSPTCACILASLSTPIMRSDGVLAQGRKTRAVHNASALPADQLEFARRRRSTSAERAPRTVTEATLRVAENGITYACQHRSPAMRGLSCPGDLVVMCVSRSQSRCGRGGTRLCFVGGRVSRRVVPGPLVVFEWVGWQRAGVRRAGIRVGARVYTRPRTRSSRSVDLSSPRALVVRDGKQVRIAGRDVVRGDVACRSDRERLPPHRGGQARPSESPRQIGQRISDDTAEV